jgi:hypothetical protein
MLYNIECNKILFQNFNILVRFEVLTEVTTKFIDLWYLVAFYG